MKSDRLAPVRFVLVKSLSKESGFHLRSSEALLEVEIPRLYPSPLQTCAEPARKSIRFDNPRQ